eukprot:m.157005 g.157005  ORF g.157005 m.157005 type:complete len:61 (+) comp31036_c0_seq1:95-277(+)
MHASTQNLTQQCEREITQSVSRGKRLKQGLLNQKNKNGKSAIGSLATFKQIVYFFNTFFP